jgi:hypothetical protein
LVESFESNADPCSGTSVEITRFLVAAAYDGTAPATNAVAAIETAATTLTTRVSFVIVTFLFFLSRDREE